MKGDVPQQDGGGTYIYSHILIYSILAGTRALDFPWGLPSDQARNHEGPRVEGRSTYTMPFLPFPKETSLNFGDETQPTWPKSLTSR